jgi:type II secretory pathway pseudopilin PulG
MPHVFASQSKHRNPDRCAAQGARQQRNAALTTAFTLNELVVVVFIIAILAAIAIPRFSRGPGSAAEAALVDNLSRLRRAIELYAAEHGHTPPGAVADGQGGAAHSAAAFIRQLTQFSAPDGTTSAVRASPHVLGPYLREIPGVPVGQYKGASTVAIDDANSPPLVTVGNEGWVYNPVTGEIIANCDDACLDGSRAYDEF